MKKINFKNFKTGPSNLLILVVVALGILFALTKIADVRQSIKTVNYSLFKKQLLDNEIESVAISGTDITGNYKEDKGRFELSVQDTKKLVDLLEEHNVDISFVPPSADFTIWHILALLSFILTPLMMWYLFKKSKSATTGGQNNIFTISKSKAKMFMPSQIKVKFDSVAGVHEAKEELQDVLDFLKNPDKYKKMGAKLTKGILLVGDPGNGKTLLAKALAGEAHCPFFSVSGSDFIEVFAGVGAARVRDLFAQARKHSPCILFIDEIDSVGRQRGSGVGSHDEREQTLNQLLAEMDGFESSASPVVVLAATNRAEILDKALLRKGRFDRKVFVPYPDLQSREEILQVHIKDIPIDPTIDVYKIARSTVGFAGSDLANLVNEATINATKKDQKIVTLADFDEARDKIILGKGRKGMMLTLEEKRVTAFHEAGHTIPLLLMPALLDPLYKVTILPRGQALGVTHSIPERDKHTNSKDEMEARVIMALGGRAAEELVFNRLDVGAASDFRKATEIVRKMVCFYGMSTELGPVFYDQNSTEHQYSEETSRKIDEEVRRITKMCYEKSLEILRNNRDKLDKLANALLEKETLFPEEVYSLLEIEPRKQHSF